MSDQWRSGGSTDLDSAVNLAIHGSTVSLSAKDVAISMFILSIVSAISVGPYVASLR